SVEIVEKPIKLEKVFSAELILERSRILLERREGCGREPQVFQGTLRGGIVDEEVTRVGDHDETSGGVFSEARDGVDLFRLGQRLECFFVEDIQSPGYAVRLDVVLYAW